MTALAVAAAAAAFADGPRKEPSRVEEESIRGLIDQNKVPEAWGLMKEARAKGVELPNGLVDDFIRATLFSGGGLPLFQCGTGPRRLEGGVGMYYMLIQWPEPDKLDFYARDRRRSVTLSAPVKLELDWSADMPETAWVTVRAEWSPKGMDLYVDGKLVGSLKQAVSPGMGAAGHVATLGTVAYPGAAAPYFKGIIGDFRSSEDGRVKGFFVLRGPTSYVQLGPKGNWKAEGFIEFKFKAMPYLTAGQKIKIPGIDPGADVPPEPVPAELADKARALIAKLGDPDWKTREKAAGDLVALGPKVRPLVAKAAAEDPDPEIRYRAADVLARLGTETTIGVETSGTFRPRLMVGP